MKRIKQLAALTLAALGLASAVSVSAAEETRTFENRFGKVEVPVKPQCVVSLHDFSLTIQLLELGVRPCGSVARKKLWSDPYFRGVQHRFDLGDTAYVGSHKSPDEEAIAMLEPDLIVGLSYHEQLKDKLSQIAPVVILPTQETPVSEWAAQLADLVGAGDRFRDQQKEYSWVIEEFKRLVPQPENVSVTTLEIYEDNFQLIGRGGLDDVIADMGLGRPVGYQNAKKGINYSLERVGDFDADIIIDTYEPLLDSREETEEFRASPQWQNLFAVKNNQFLYFNRSRYGDSMGGLTGSAYLLLSHIAERDLKTQK
ncbi:ABC transporter substrate-binding protein [Marinobacterium jannaschii]|uniref:ABC transporter substrate-binding protein n=1 Tax=Marinobacterium jannaschii TaxID=64970 RepID=UPI000485746C|nr:ABC transporter substrate-binding protein [Marinobacterium jannaschii]